MTESGVVCEIQAPVGSAAQTEYNTCDTTKRREKSKFP